MMFYVGQRVVCIAKGTWGDEMWKRLVKNNPVENGIYTIRSISEAKGKAKGEIALRFVEISNPPVNWEWNGEGGTEEPGWGQQWFRPLVEHKTDISIFTKMLAGNKIHENS